MRNVGVQTAEEALEIAVFSKTPQRRLLDPAEVGALAVYWRGIRHGGSPDRALNLDGGMVMY